MAQVSTRALLADRRPILCVTIDCERDKGPGWRARRPLSFGGVHRGLGERLDPLFRHFGVKPTYLLSPEVMRNAAAAERIARLPGSAERGAHLHAEYVGPDLDDEAESLIFQAALSPAQERAKLEALTRLFVDTFGERPRSFRAGRFGIGAASLGILAHLGYTVDSSVTPFVDWSGAGPGAPSFAHAPTTAYRPDLRAPAAPGAGPIWEVPLTIRPRIWQRQPLARRFLQRRLRHRWLRPTWGSARALIDLAREVWRESAAGEHPAPPIWNVMFHNVEVVAGASPYARDESQAGAILGRLAALLDFARDAGARSVGLGELPDLLARREPPAPSEVRA
ncbi:MAG TPA: hypothetical protein VFH68_19345 [Polyangia bacterium]|nr:hypothetical protein [Polyangia bacterium]